MSVAADVRGASAQGASVRVAYVTALVTGVGGYVRGFFVWGWCQKASDRGLVFGSHLPHRELRSDKHLGIKLLLLLRTFTSRKYNIAQRYRSSNQIPVQSGSRLALYLSLLRLMMCTICSVHSELYQQDLLS